MHLSGFLSEPSCSPPAVPHPSGFPQPENRLYVPSFQPGGQNKKSLFMSPGKYHKRKAQQHQWRSARENRKNTVGIYLCLPLHEDHGCQPPHIKHIYFHKVQSPLTQAIVSWYLWTLMKRSNIWKAVFVNRTVLNRTILLANCF